MPLFDVKAPNGKVYRVNAPRGASVDDAVAYVKAMLEPEQALEEDIEPPKPEAGFFGALGESLADPVRFGAESAAFAANQTPETRAALLKAAESQYSPDAQFGEGANWEAFKNLAGRSAGQMIAPLTVGAATSVAATPVAGIAAGFATSAAQYENQNILDQAQRQQQAIDQGKAPEAFDLGRSLVASGLQAGLDVAQVGVISKILNKFPIAKGLVNGDRQATTLLTNALEQGNVTFTGKVMKGVAGNVAFEIPQEIGQQALTLWQSHQPLDDENAIREYSDAAVGAFVLGGTIGGVAGGAGYFTRNRGDKPLTPAETPDEAESAELPSDLRGLSGSGIRGLNVTLPEAQIPSLTPIDQGSPLTLNPFPPDESGGSGAPPPPPNEPPGGAPSGLASLIARQNNQGYDLSRLPQPSVSFPYTPGNLPGALPTGVNAAMPEGVNVGIDISTQLAKLAEAEAKRKKAEAEARAAEAAFRQGDANGNNAGSSRTAGNPPGGATGAGTGVPPSTENPEGGDSGKPNSEGVDATGADAQGTLFGEPDGNAPLGGKPKILSGAEADAAALSVIEANDGVVDMAAITEAVGSNPKAIAAVNRLKKKKVLANSVDDSHAEGTLATIARNNRIIDERTAPKSEAADAFEEGDITELNDDFAPETVTLDDGKVIDKGTGEILGQEEGPAPEEPEPLYFQTQQAPEAPAAGAPKLTGAAKFRADLESSISFLRNLGAETESGQWKSFINNRLGLRLEDGYANSILDRMREQGIVRNKMGKLSFNEAPRGTSTNATPSTTPTTPAAPAAAPSTPSAARPSTPTTPTAAAAAAPAAAAPSTPSAPAAAPAGPPKVKVTTKIGVPKIPKAGKDVNGVKAIVDSVLAGWKNAPEVSVFQSLSDLPANIRSRVPSNAKGFLMGGKVFIIADNAKSDSGIRATLFHESLGHAGLRGKFGTELNKMLYDMHKTHKGIREAADAWMKRNPNAYTNLSKEDRISMAVEEIIAEHSEHGDTRTIWTSYGLNKIAALVRSFLRQLGIVRAYSTNDIANIVRQAHEHIIEGPGGPGGGVKTATTTGTPKTPAPIQFQRGESKVSGPYSLKAIPPLITDNPGGEWLVNQRKDAASKGRKVSGAPEAFGAETAGFDGPVTLPVSVLKNIRGINDEQNNVRTESLDSLVEHMGENNRLPLGPFTGKEYPPFITVDQDGTPFVNEGNHRIMAAAKLGWDYLPVRLRYFSGGERADGILKPSTIKEKYGATEGDIQFQRSDTNSNGIPIYNTKKGIKNFYKWFGDSKIVDADGNPLVLYHGMENEMEGGTFRVTQNGSLGEGIYFTDDPVIAEQFANGSRGYREPEQKGNLVPAYLKMERPFDDAFLAEHPDWQKWILDNIVNWSDRTPYYENGPNREIYASVRDKLARGEATVADLVYMDTAGRSEFPWVSMLTDAVKKHDYFDGIVLRNPVVTANKKAKYGMHAFTEYVVFKPEQVKSTIGNNGQFSVLSPDIQFQVDKKAIDSLGLPVHPTEAGQNNLLNKFGKVKPLIRDINGRVLRLYHGSFTSGIKALRSPIQRKEEDERISTMLGVHLAPDSKISDRFAFDTTAVTLLKDPAKQNPYLSGQAVIEGGVVYPVYARGKMLDLRTNDRNGFDDAHVADAVIEHSMTPEYVAKTIRINDGSDVDEDQIKYLMRWWKESADKNTLYADPPDYVKQNVPIRYQYLTKNKFLNDMITGYVQYGNLENNEQETLDVVNDFILNSGYDGIIYTNTNSFETEDASNLDSYIIFHSNDMKSAMGNTGAFSEKDNMQFQREATSLFNSAAEAWNNIPTGNNKTIEEFLGFLEKFPGWLKRITFGMMSLSHIAETFKGHPMGAAVSRVESILNRRASKLDRRRNILVKNLEKWNEIAITHKDKLNEFFDIANGTTVDQIEFLKKGPNGKYVFDENAPESDLKRRFLALPEALQKTYMELRDSYGDMSEELINRISSAVSDDSIAKKLRNDYEKNRLQVYLPLFRSGSYWLSYFHNGENVTRSFENPRARRKAQGQMEEKGATEFASYERLNDRLNDRAQPPAGFVAEVITELRENGATQDMIDSVYETYMSYVPAQSIRQMFREREGVPGFEPDVFQAYANVATKMMNQLNNLEFTVSLDEATAEVNDAARLGSGASRTTATLGAAASNVVKQVEFIRNPTNNSLIDGASYWSYMWNIAGNVSSGIVNATQLGLVVYPILAGKYGFAKTATAMDNATKMFFDGGRDTSGSTFLPDFTFYKDSLSQDYKDLFETAMDRSAIRSSSGQQLSEMRNNSTEDYTGLKAKVSHGLGFVFQNTERFNREVTLLAAYQLAKDKGMGHDASVNEAIRVINEAHGTALPETGPRFFQKGLGKVAFTFKRFAQAQIYLLQKLFRTAFSNSDDVTRDMARRQLLGIYGMSYLFAGMQGMPLFGAAEVLANMLFGDEDEPFDLNEKVRESVGDLGYKGPINKLFNIDIAARTGFNGMVWRDDSKRAAEIGMTLYVAEHIFGPAYGIVRGVEQGAKQINQGDWYRGLESMTPSIIRNGMKGMRYAVDGATNKDGVPIVDDVNGYNAFMQIAGFTPADLAAARDRAGVMKEAERKITQRRSSLLDRLDGALQNGDYSGAQEIRKDINEFNKAHPQKGVKITSDTIKDSRKGKREKENSAVDGVYLPDAMREELVEVYGN